MIIFGLRAILEYDSVIKSIIMNVIHMEYIISCIHIIY